MSDMLQLVVSCGGFDRTSKTQQISVSLRFKTQASVYVESTATHDKLKHIGHSLSHCCPSESTEANDELRAYRTLVESFLSG